MAIEKTVRLQVSQNTDISISLEWKQQKEVIIKSITHAYHAICHTDYQFQYSTH